MQKQNELNRKEKTQREIIKILIFLIVVIVIKGIYNQSNGIDQDYILFPAFLGISSIFCFIYTFNAFKSGNIVKNWANTKIFTFLFNHFKKNKLISDDIANKKAIKIFGLFIFVLGLISLIVGFFWFYTGGW